MKRRCRYCGLPLPALTYGGGGFHYCANSNTHVWNDHVAEEIPQPESNLTVQKLLALRESLTTRFFVHDEEMREKVHTILNEAKFPGFWKIEVNEHIEKGKIIKLEPQAFKWDIP